jgi:hypothetical protein
MKDTNNMATVEEYSRVSRLNFVLKVIGDRFPNLKEFVTMISPSSYRARLLNESLSLNT